MKLIIMQGPSGSGKSTKAQELVAETKSRGGSYIICSSDNFFVDRKTGEYNWDVNKLRAAHSWCRTRAEMAMEYGWELVVIDNTNTRKWEYQAYLDMAEEFGYEVEICRVGQLDESNLKVYAERNVHGVPLDTIRKQAERIKSESK